MVSARRIPTSTRYWLAGLAGYLILLSLRALIPGRDLNQFGILGAWDTFFAIALLVFFVLISAGLGWRLSGWLFPGAWSGTERLLLSFGAGTGVIGTSLAGLALFGWLTPVAVLATLPVCLIISGNGFMAAIKALLALSAGYARVLRRGSGFSRLILWIATLFFALSGLLALGPPFEYDAVMYHLPGAEIFLQAGKFVLLPDLMQANAPFLGEMLFLFGLVTQASIYTRLVQLTFALAVVIAIFVFGKKYVSLPVAWLAAGVFLGIPILVVWSNWAYIDFIWTYYAFLAVVVFYRWTEAGGWSLGFLAGMFAGFSVGAKIVALPWLLTFAVLILAALRQQELKSVLKAGLAFSMAVLITAGVWYLKNWLLSGNPVYPLIWGGPGYDAQRLALMNEFMGSFGQGQRPLDLLLLLPRLYFHHDQFGTADLDMPSLLFPLSLGYIFLPKNKFLSISGLVTLGHLLAWFYTSQQVRFLLPVFPLVSLITAYVLISLAERIRSPLIGRVITIVPVASLAAITLVTGVVAFSYVPTFAVSLGLESQADYLLHAPTNFAAVQYIQENLAGEDRVLMLWEGRWYYCMERCIPDTDRTQWTHLILSSQDVDEVNARLQAKQISHLLYSKIDLEFMRKHDPSGSHQQADEFFLEHYVGQCALEVFANETHVLYDIRPCYP